MQLVRPPTAFPDQPPAAVEAPSLASAVADRADAPAGETVRAETTRFAAALLLAAAAHVGAAVWALRTPPAALADNAPPAAIVVDIMEVPEAVRTEMNNITPDETTSKESTPQQEQKAEEKPEQPTEPTPEPELTEPVQQPVVEEKPVPEQPVEDPLPEQPKPEPPKEQPKKEQPKPEPPKEKLKETPKEKPRDKPKERAKPSQPQQSSEDSRAASQSQARARQSDRNAATQAASGASSASPATWQARLMAHLSRSQRYPPGTLSRGEQATAHVRFSIDASGRVLSVSLARSSGNSALDQEVVAMVRRASPVPAPPPGIQREIVAPIRFRAN